MANKSPICLFILVLLIAFISCETKNVTAKDASTSNFGNFFRKASFGRVETNERKAKKLQPYLAKKKAAAKAEQKEVEPKRFRIDVSLCSANFKLESLFPLSGEPVQLTNEVKEHPKVARGRFLGVGNKFVPRRDGVIKALRYYPTPKNQDQGRSPPFFMTGLVRSLSTVVYDSKGRIFSGGDYFEVNQNGWIYSPLYEPVAVRAGETWYPTTTIHAGDEYYQKEHANLDNQKSLTAPKGVSVRFDRVDSIKTNENLNFLDVLFMPHNTFFPATAVPTATDVAPLRFLQTNFEYVNTFKPKVDGKIYGIRYYHMPGDITPQHFGRFAKVENDGLGQILSLVSEVLGGYKFDESSNEEGWRTYYLPYGLNVYEGDEFAVSVNFKVETLDGLVPGVVFASAPINQYLQFVESGFGLLGQTFTTTSSSAYLIDVLFNPNAECLGETNLDLDESFGLQLIGALASEMIPQFGSFQNVLEALGGLGGIDIGIGIRQNQTEKQTRTAVAKSPRNQVLGIPDTTPVDFSSCRNDRTVETLFGYDDIRLYSRGKSERKIREKTAVQSIQIGNTFLPKRSGVIKAFKFYRPEGDSSHVPDIRDRFFSFYFHTLRVGVPVALLTGETPSGWQYVPTNPRGLVVEKGFLLDFTYDVYKKSKYLELENNESRRRRNSLSIPAGIQGERTFIQLVEEILDHPIQFVGEVIGGGAVSGSSFTKYLYDFYPNITKSKVQYPLDALFVPFQGALDQLFDEEDKKSRGERERRPDIRFDDHADVESGNVVSFSEYGLIYGVTFYKKQNDMTERSIKVWEYDEGKRVGSPLIREQPVYFESQTGWQDSIYFEEPIMVDPTKKYVISVNYNSNAAYIQHELPITNGFVTLEGSVVGTAGSYPSQSTRGVNLVDVLFLVNNECFNEECVTKKTA